MTTVPVLRTILAIIGMMAFFASLIGVVVGLTLAFSLWFFGIGLVLTLGVLFERVHYKILASKTPGADWVITPERFVDPTSGRMVQVYTKPKTGERLYVDADAAPNPRAAPDHYPTEWHPPGGSRVPRDTPHL
jgi:hypothetical protein